MDGQFYPYQPIQFMDGLLDPVIGAGAQAEVVGTFLQANSISSDLTTYTFSGENFGTAEASRRIVVGIAPSQSGQSISSVTIGGVAADIVVQATGGTGATAGLAIAHVPTGTSGDVVVTLGSGDNRCGIGLWSITGLTSNAAFDSDSSTADPATFTLSNQNGGFAIGLGSDASTGGNTHTWSGLTEQFDNQVAGEGSRFSGAHLDTTGTDISVSCDYAGSNSRRAMVAASW